MAARRQTAIGSMPVQTWNPKTATTSKRSRISPTPGRPAGNDEKNRCTYHKRTTLQPCVHHRIVVFRSEVNDAPPQSDGHRLGPISGSQFLHHVFQMDLHGLLGDEQLVADVAVPPARGEPLKNLELA